MENNSQILITISRQLGSGGGYIGRALSKELNIKCYDKEIVSQAAKKLSALEEDLSAREEKIPSFWKSFFQSTIYTAPDIYLPVEALLPSQEAIFKAQSEIITHIADNKDSAIIIGRCGASILHEHKNHISFFFCANTPERIERLVKLYGISKDEALEMIEESDEQRARYHSRLTDKEWKDVTQYDFAINTSKFNIDALIPFLLSYLKSIKKL